MTELAYICIYIITVSVMVFLMCYIYIEIRKHNSKEEHKDISYEHKDITSRILVEVVEVKWLIKNFYESIKEWATKL